MRNTQNSDTALSRRKFIGTSILTATGFAVGVPSVFGAPAILKNYGKAGGSLINGVQIGVITYSFRSLPDQSAEATLKYVTDCGLSAVELMGDPAENFAGMPKNTVDRGAFFGLMRKTRDGGELTADEQKQMEEMRAEMDSHSKEVAQWRTTVSMDKFKQVKKMYADAGVKIYAFKPSAFGQRNTDAEIDYGFRAAKALGASHVTLEHPSDDQHTKKLGEMAAKHKVYVAYHGHEQQTPTFWDTALQQSKYNALNLDAGHYVAAGNPPVIDLIKAKHDRILSMHIKDRQKPDNGKGNLPWGEGDTPLGEILQLMSTKKYKFPATIELEYEIPKGSDAVTEVKKCLDFCVKTMA
jgi:sugar phosphate isomerase/epimerase